MKANHNRAITKGDQSYLGWHETAQPKSPRLKRYEKIHKAKWKKKINSTYAQYGSLEEIRKARMANYTERKGWVKITDNTAS